MKKLFVLILSFICMFSLTGCNASQTINFSGTHDYFKVEGVSLTITEDSEMFDYGTLIVTEPSAFENVVSCEMKFFTVKNDERNYPAIYTATFEPEGSELTEIILGNGGSINGSKHTSDLLKNGEAELWFELKIKDNDDTENVYQIQLTVID